MDLFLIRHAIAEDGPDDDDARPLSAKGIKRFKGTVCALELLGVRFDRIIHSPKVRAVQTAELLAPLLTGKLESSPLLAISPSAAVLALLSGEVLGVVGHEPYLSTLLAWLVTGEATLGGAFELKKGSVARLTGSPTPAGMRLNALLPPSVMRRMTAK